MKKPFSDYGGFFDIEKRRSALFDIEKQLEDSSVWSKPEVSRKLLSEKKTQEDIVTSWDLAKKKLEELRLLAEMADQEEDQAVLEDVERELSQIEKTIRDFETRSLLSGEHDSRDAIVSITPGAGGVEAQDWVEMLLRMYLMWCRKKGFETEILDIQAGEGAGLKSVTFVAHGPYAYGYFRSEVGIHRLVRISPFDANKRRHTSFAAVSAIPDIAEEIKIEIRDEEIRVDTYRSSGAGGQHVNVTDSAVRITHFPTGIVVQCQNERSQRRNKEVALKVLKARLYERELEFREEKIKKEHAAKGEIAWGNQIRSYVFQPYQLVKDHRTDVEVGNVQGVMDGEIDSFVEEYLLHKSKKSA